MHSIHFLAWKVMDRKFVVRTFCVCILLVLSLDVWAATFDSSAQATIEPIERIAFGSCNSPHRPPLWSLINNQFHPKKLILLGDTIYADREPGDVVTKKLKNPSVIQSLYDQVAADEGFKQMAGDKNNLMATYDDHDYGQNNGDKYFEFKGQSQVCHVHCNIVGLISSMLQAFFWDFVGESRTSSRRQQNGVYSSRIFSSGIGTKDSVRYKIVLLDTRSNKDAKGTNNGDFLGEEQWAWLENELQDNSNLDFLLLGSPIQFLPTSKLVEESWNEFPSARSRLYKLILSASGTTDVILLSGDVHCGEMLQAKCHDDVGNQVLNVHEFTSSGLSHTFTELVAKADDGSLILKSRGFHHDLLYNLYQAVIPARYREQHYAHHYQGPHFTILDVRRDLETQQISLHFQYFDHSGLKIMEKTLKTRTSHEREEFRAYLLSSRHNSPSDALNSLVCVPYWGEIGMAREVVTRSIIAFYLLVLVVLPLCGILWFTCASLYFVTVGAENERRRIILERNRASK